MKFPINGNYFYLSILTIQSQSIHGNIWVLMFLIHWVIYRSLMEYIEKHSPKLGDSEKKLIEKEMVFCTINLKQSPVYIDIYTLATKMAIAWFTSDCNVVVLFNAWTMFSIKNEQRQHCKRNNYTVSYGDFHYSNT